MKRIRIIFVISICIIAGILIAGCTQPAPTPPVTNSGAAAVVQTSLAVLPATGNPVTNSGTAVIVQTSLAVQSSMANPASVSCGKIGGSTEIRKNVDGSEYGMCNFANGTSCEEWALFRGEGCNTRAPVTTNTSTMTGMANPASVNCGKIGGATEIRKNADGNEYGVCSFSNGTTCEEWALYRGEGCNTSATAPAK